MHRKNFHVLISHKYSVTVNKRIVGNQFDIVPVKPFSKQIHGLPEAVPDVTGNNC